MSIYQKGKNWYIDYYFKGRRKRKKIGPSKKLAEQVLKDVHVKLAKSEFLGIHEEKKLLFKDYAEQYKEYSKTVKAPSSVTRDKEIITKHLAPALEDQYLFQIALDDVEHYRAKRLKDDASPSTINKEVNLLKAMLNRAVEWKYLKANPLQGFRQLKEPPGRLRYLNPEEFQNLITACSSDAGLLAVVQLALYTGMRRGEILNLKWENIDLQKRLVLLEKTKTNERRIIPINDTLAEVLKNIPRSEESKDTDIVFPGLSGNMLSMAFRRACGKAKITNFRFHDLRHTFASHLTMAGYNQRTIQHLLGHKDPRMTVRYAHLSDDYLSQAVKALDQVFAPSKKVVPTETKKESDGHHMDTGTKKGLRKVP